VFTRKAKVVSVLVSSGLCSKGRCARTAYPRDTANIIARHFAQAVDRAERIAHFEFTPASTRIAKLVSVQDTHTHEIMQV